MADDPLTYRHGGDYVVTEDIEDIYSSRWDSVLDPFSEEDMKTFIHHLLKRAPRTEKELNAASNEVRRQLKIAPRRSQLLHALQRFGGAEGAADVSGADAYDVDGPEVAGGGDGSGGEPEPSPYQRLSKLLVKKASKSQSGVLVITVLTSPYPVVDGKKQKFSCAWNCYYCPNEPGQPRSYLHDEPAVKRANENGFDAVLQFTDRGATLAMNGHPVDKIELLVLGGTWTSYPLEYREEFVRDLFYAANTFGSRHAHRRQERYSLAVEQKINESAACKIIGLTLETRPDTIDAEEVRRLRSYGCTRVQLGVQHTDDAVLRKINRGCYTEDTISALRQLKDACFKVDVHLMPNLPGASVETDRTMFDAMLYDEALQADQWKIYPCEITPWTVIKKWYDQGNFEPYGETDLCELLAEVKGRVHPWIRLNRVVRDIPSQYVLGGVDAPNLRQVVLNLMAKRGHRCRCIRCREVGDNSKATANAQLMVRRYQGSGSPEEFYSFETDDGKETILGFLRLRLPARGKPYAVRPAATSIHSRSQPDGGTTAAATDAMPAVPPFPELVGCALIRELHVYGQLVSTSATKRSKHAQHIGLGRRMMSAAEDRAAWCGYRKVAVISGIGARNYYRKLGYEVEGEGGFMIKHLSWRHPQRLKRLAAFVMALMLALALASTLAYLCLGSAVVGRAAEPSQATCRWHARLPFSRGAGCTARSAAPVALDDGDSPVLRWLRRTRRSADAPASPRARRPRGRGSETASDARQQQTIPSSSSLLQSPLRAGLVALRRAVGVQPRKQPAQSA